MVFLALLLHAKMTYQKYGARKHAEVARGPVESSQKGSLDGDNVDVIAAGSMVQWIVPTEQAVSLFALVKCEQAFPDFGLYSHQNLGDSQLPCCERTRRGCSGLGMHSCHVSRPIFCVVGVCFDTSVLLMRPLTD